MQNYITKTGDTFASVSLLFYGTSEFEGKIAEFNKLEPRRTIKEGQTIVLPDIFHKIVKIGKSNTEPSIKLKAFPIRKIIKQTISVQDENGAPMPGAGFEIIINKKQVFSGKLDNNGNADVDVPEDGNFLIKFIGTK